MNYVHLLPILGGLFGVLALFAAMRAGRNRRLIDNLPTCKTTGVFIGLVELKGTAEVENPLRSHLAETACVQYRWSVQEQWSRTVTETYTDSNGNTQTRTRTESGWTIVDQGGETNPFYLKDDLGVVQIVPDGAKIEPAMIFNETCGPGSPLYYAKGPQSAVADSDHRRLFQETAIPLHAPIYVMGQARERKDVVAPEIAADPAAPIFLISTAAEERVSRSYGCAFWGWWIFALALTVGAFIAREQMLKSPSATVRWGGSIYAALGFLAAALLGWVWMVHNSLIDLRQRVNSAWSQVDVQLKRRRDLIPNLVQTVTASRDHERELQTELAHIRAQVGATPPGSPGPDPSSLAATVMAIAERYPNLKAQESFLNLQRNLSDTEQRIALARGYFNSIATAYNTRLDIVPDRFVGALARLKSRALLSDESFERAPIQINLAE